MSNRIGRWLGAVPATPQTLKEAIKAYNEGAITTEQLREAWDRTPVADIADKAVDPDAALALIHEQLAPSLAVCGASAADGALYTATNLGEVTCSDCREAREYIKRHSVAPMTVSGGSGVTWTTDEYPVADDWPAVPISADQIDSEIIGKIDMISTIDEHLTVTADRVEEMAERLDALQKAMESLQEAAPGPATPTEPDEPSVAPTPSSDLRDDILAVLEEFGHDPEVAAEIIAERCRAEAPEDAPGPAALPERHPVINTATLDAMTVEDRVLVKEALERGDCEVQPDGSLRVVPSENGEFSEWLFTEEGWRWADARTIPEVDEAELAEELWRANLETLGSSHVPLSTVSPAMGDRYREMAERITTVMHDPDRTFLR